MVITGEYEIDRSLRETPKFSEFAQPQAKGTGFLDVLKQIQSSYETVEPKKRERESVKFRDPNQRQNEIESSRDRSGQSDSVKETESEKLDEEDEDKEKKKVHTENLDLQWIWNSGKAVSNPKEKELSDLKEGPGLNAFAKAIADPKNTKTENSIHPKQLDNLKEILNSKDLKEIIANLTKDEKSQKIDSSILKSLIEKAEKLIKTPDSNKSKLSKNTEGNKATGLLEKASVKKTETLIEESIAKQKIKFFSDKIRDKVEQKQNGSGNELAENSFSDKKIAQKMSDLQPNAESNKKSEFSEILKQNPDKWSVIRDKKTESGPSHKNSSVPELKANVESTSSKSGEFQGGEQRQSTGDDRGALNFPWHRNLDRMQNQALEKSEFKSQFEKDVKSNWQSLVKTARVRIVDEGKTTASIQLRPKDLGRLSLRISVEKDRVHGRILVESESIKQILSSDLASMKQDLKEQGLFLESLQIDVHDETMGSWEQYASESDSNKREEYENQISSLRNAKENPELVDPEDTDLAANRQSQKILDIRA